MLGCGGEGWIREKNVLDSSLRDLFVRDSEARQNLEE